MKTPVKLFFLSALLVLDAQAAPSARHIAGFEEADAWSVQATDDVSAHKLSTADGLCLDFNFNGVAGYVTLKRQLPLDNSGNFALSFRVRGNAPANDLQMKLVDAGGDNVWWKRWLAFQVSDSWQNLQARRNEIEFAWGPRKDHGLAATRSIEFVISAASGGHGRTCFDQLALTSLPPAKASATPAPSLHNNPNAYLLKLAKQAAPGRYPRGLSGQQVYWTLVGVDGGGAHSALLSEDGALEPGLGGYSIEPFLVEHGKVTTWADAAIQHSLADGYLPMPAATWRAGSLKLEIAPFAAGTPQSSRLVACYTVSNQSAQPRTLDLALAVRPYQVDPPTQFLNTRGGISPIHDLGWQAPLLDVNGTPAVYALQHPDRVLFSRLDGGGIVPVLAHPPETDAASLHDDAGFGAAALIYHLKLPAHGQRSIVLVTPLNGRFDPAAAIAKPDDWIDAQRRQTAAYWHRQLDRVQLVVPKRAQPVADTLNTALADILMSRDGPALHPGTRSYARAWIRDGAMMSAGLLRLDHAAAVHDFLNWYAPHQFSNGKVPCCVDKRGSDPVPENDSQGELIFTAAEYLRYTGDRDTVQALWPRLRHAAAYMETLRQSLRGDQYAHGDNKLFFGLMPASISHEGYSAKPQHSYWDDFWSLTGYKDAVWLAQTLGHEKAARTLARQRDEFAHDLYASIKLSQAEHHIDYIPGSADLGDFDATSTTIALTPGGELKRLPQKPLHATFERYWKEFVARRDNTTNWQDYTPYELRTIGSFVRLGWRQRIPALLDFFMDDRRPAAWNQWAEVVGRDPRQPRFVGDMPHAWVASDYIRSVLDMFAWHRHEDDAMVLAAGLPESWLDGQDTGIDNLRTPWGRLSYRLSKTGDTLHLKLQATGTLPPGGFVLPWPLADAKPGVTSVNSQPAQWQDAQLRIRKLKARIAIKLEMID